SRLAAIFGREHSVGLQDIGYASSNISVRTVDGGNLTHDCIAIFDQTYGSLRLTERLFLEFGTLLNRLRSGMEAEGLPEDQIASAEAFKDWFAKLEPANPPPESSVAGLDFSRY